MTPGVGPDQATRVVLVRHGETDWNSQMRIQGHRDIPLNERGLWQAERVAQALESAELQAIYSSDLQRANATARAVGQRIGVPVVDDPGLRERAFGIFEGSTFADLELRWPDQVRRWRRRDADFGPEGGERLGDFYARCVAAASALCARHPGQSIALVAHGGVLDCLYRAATGAELDAPRSWQLGNASLNRVLYGASGFVLVGWNDTLHLDAG